ncbi:MAG TPA: CehA/McbA family metallohydrolase [Polyangiaceae bacterium]|jgi:hypothetical protein
MQEYEPLDLSPFYNTDWSIVGGQGFPFGDKAYHGLPFRFGAEGEKCILGFGSGLNLEKCEIPVGRAVRHVIFAHRLLESRIAQGGPAGQSCASYLFKMEGGDSVSVPIRERLEIGALPCGWGEFAILAYPDAKDELEARYRGRWDGMGRRQTEVIQGWPTSFYLWVWTNLRPERVLQSITVAAEGPRFLLAAITLGHLEEFPFNQHARLDVKLRLRDETDQKPPFNLSVQVDRGNATYPYPLPEQTPAQFLADAFSGWGQEQNPVSSPAHLEIAANPSATVTVKRGEEILGQARWGEVLEKGAVESERLRIELVDRGRNWVHTTVVDAETGKPVPCRVHFRSVEGIPYQPHGHHNYVNSNLDSWNLDVGGDLRLGQITYAYIDGTCQGWLPRGEVLVDIARGFEYEPIRTKLEIKPGQRELSFELRRWRNMNRERYFSGDTHVHFLSTQGAHTEAAAEDLNVVNLLQSQWGHLFTDTEEFTGHPSVSAGGRHIVYTSQENRQHTLGHLILLGLKHPVMPWCSDGPGEAELGGNLETTVARWADACHAQGGTVVLPHMPNPNCEPAALIATGRLDAVEMCDHWSSSVLEYYRYLNCGYRLPLAGGTDKMCSAVPVGLYRTYVHIPEDEPFDYDSWCRNLRRGNTFISSGPLLSLRVEGNSMGATVTLPAGGGTVEVEALAQSTLPFHCLEIVVNGTVVARVEEAEPVRRLELREKLKIDRHSWIAARSAGAGFTRLSHHDSWRRGILAHTSPVYLEVGEKWQMFDPDIASYLLTMVHGGLEYVRRHARHWKPGTVTHHHGRDDHGAYLEEPFLQALEAIEKRMREH